MDIRKLYSGSMYDTMLAIMLLGLPTTTNQRVFIEDVDSLVNMSALVNKLANSTNVFDRQSITRLMDIINSGEALKYGYKKKIQLVYYPESNDFYPLPNDAGTSKPLRKKTEMETQLRMVV